MTLTLQEHADEAGITLPPEGVNLNQHAASLPTQQCEQFVAFLNSLPTISSPEEDAIRETIAADLAAVKTPEDLKKLFENAVEY
jgi:hypothetical protein